MDARLRIMELGHILNLTYITYLRSISMHVYLSD